MIEALEAPGTFERARVDRAAGVLLGSVCSGCGMRAWPSKAMCSACGYVMRIGVPLPKAGTLVSYTKVWTPRSGLPVPYLLGQIELAGGVQLFAHVRAVPEGATTPFPVRLVLPDAPQASPIEFWWEPSEESA